MHAHSTDIETAFLNADLKVKIVIRQPMGAKDGNALVMRLLEILYGLKQTTRVGMVFPLPHHTHNPRHEAVHLRNIQASMYSMNHLGNGNCIVLVYVDGILVVSVSLAWVSKAKQRIRQQFGMTNFGNTTFTPGRDISRDLHAGTVRLSQEQYARVLLDKYSMLDNNPILSRCPPLTIAMSRQRLSFGQDILVARSSRNIPYYSWARQLPLHVHTTRHRFCDQCD
jgi:hypothetical protein